MPVSAYLWSVFFTITVEEPQIKRSSNLSAFWDQKLSKNFSVNSGWPTAYYFHGSLSVICAILFIFLFTNNPKKHPLVSEAEVNTITDGGGLTIDLFTLFDVDIDYNDPLLSLCSRLNIKRLLL